MRWTESQVRGSAQFSDGHICNDGCRDPLVKQSYRRFQAGARMVDCGSVSTNLGEERGMGIVHGGTVWATYDI